MQLFMICLSWTCYNGAVVLVESVPQHSSDDFVLLLDVLNVDSALCTPIPVIHSNCYLNTQQRANFSDQTFKTRENF